MATVDTKPDVLLDRLQQEINLILTHTGHIFQASNASNTPPVAQVAKLKRDFPPSLNRFNDALDGLAVDLHMAKLVMRRDLAVAREKLGITAEPPVLTPAQTIQETAVSMTIKNETPVADRDPDVLMADATDDDAAPAAATAAAAVSSSDDTHDIKDDTASTVEQDLKPQAAQTVHSPLKSEPSVAPNADPAADDTSPAGSLGEEDKGPDTVDTNDVNTNADLDSLFNDPQSAATGGPGSVDFNATDNNEFDFGNFNASFDDGGDDESNDLSTLLPGLSEYAKNAGDSSAEPDFSALFATDNNAQDNAAKQDEDATDDAFNLMDFASFNAENGNDDGNIDLDFDFS